MKKVAILAIDQGAFFEMGCAVEVFGLPRPEFKDWYQCEVVSFEEAPLSLTSGVRLLAKHIHSLDDYSMLVVPCWPTKGPAPREQLANEILKFYRNGNRIISFCSGAFLLAELGILDGRNATTHWRYAERLKQRFPNINYVDDVLYVYDGQLGCSAGSAAALDLSIEVVRGDYGYKTANHVARQLVLSSHRSGGQSQFVETPVLKSPSRFSETLDWALNNLDNAINVDTLASKASMSRRTFHRKFKSTFNKSPNEWLTEQRLSLAKELLIEHQYSVDKISQLAGFGNPITMRHHFNKNYGISPLQYREQFKSR